MSLITTISTELKEAMKNKDVLKRDTLRMLKALTDNTMKEQGVTELKDIETIGLVRREIKKRRDSILLFVQGGRTDLADKETLELVVLESLLPKGMTADEVERHVLEAITRVGATSKKDMGKVMKAIPEEVKAAVDGKTLSTAVQALLP